MKILLYRSSTAHMFEVYEEELLGLDPMAGVEKITHGEPLGYFNLASEKGARIAGEQKVDKTFFVEEKDFGEKWEKFQTDLEGPSMGL